MADVTRDQSDWQNNNMGNSTPVGYEYNDRTYRESPLLEDVAQGDQLKQVANGWRKCAPGERADGIALKFGKAGMVGFSIGVIGEMDGFLELTVGTKLYPSATTDGALQTDAVAGFVAQVHVCRPGRIRFNYTI